MEEPKDEVGALTESCTTAIHLGTHLAAVGRSSIAERVFDIAMTPLLGLHIVELYCKLGCCDLPCRDPHATLGPR
jgi:hypothetical protein